MKKKLQSFEALILFGLYFIPLILWSLFSFSHMKASSHWTLFAMGLLIAVLGTLALRLLTASPEESVRPTPAPIPKPEPIVEAPPKPLVAAPVAPPSPDPQLLQEVESLKSQIEELKGNFRTELEDLKFNLEQSEIASENSQKALLKKEQEVEELKLKINELEYEIKALIDFNEEAASYDPTLSEALALNETEASRILKKWIEAAGALSPTAIGDIHDRELTGNLGKLIQGEPGALVFLYSLKEGKALFANGHTLTLFGLTPEEFAAQFHTLLPKESREWHEAVAKMAEEKWAALPLKGARAVLAPVSRGPLQGYCLGVAY